MKRWRGWFVMAALAALSVFTFGFRALPDHLLLELPYAPELTQQTFSDEQLVAAAQKHYGVDIKGKTAGHLQLVGKLSAVEGHSDRVLFKGNAQMLLGTSTYVVRINRDQGILRKHTLESGKTVYYGILHGETNGRASKQSVDIVLSFDETFTQGQATVTTGVMGDDAIMAFGEVFLTPADVAEMTK